MKSTLVPHNLQLAPIFGVNIGERGVYDRSKTPREQIQSRVRPDRPSAGDHLWPRPNGSIPSGGSLERLQQVAELLVVRRGVYGRLDHGNSLREPLLAREEAGVRKDRFRTGGSHIGGETKGRFGFSLEVVVCQQPGLCGSHFGVRPGVLTLAARTGR